jgi:serine-type D-Ala-D-Ala carboxypeptidase (penicillin-binding protein 5/6)
VTPNLTAPIARATSIGELQVMLGQDVIARQALHPIAKVEQGGLWRRMIDSMWLWFE